MNHFRCFYTAAVVVRPSEHLYFARANLPESTVILPFAGYTLPYPSIWYDLSLAVVYAFLTNRSFHTIPSTQYSRRSEALQMRKCEKRRDLCSFLLYFHSGSISVWGGGGAAECECILHWPSLCSGRWRTLWIRDIVHPCRITTNPSSFSTTTSFFLILRWHVYVRNASIGIWCFGEQATKLFSALCTFDMNYEFAGIPLLLLSCVRALSATAGRRAVRSNENISTRRSATAELPANKKKKKPNVGVEHWSRSRACFVK